MKLTLEEALNSSVKDKSLGTFHIEENEVIVVPEFILKNLSGKYEVLILSLILGVCKKYGTFYGSMNYIASRVHCNIPYATNTVKKLCKKGLLIKSEVKNEHKTYDYTVPEELYEILSQE